MPTRVRTPRASLWAQFNWNWSATCGAATTATAEHRLRAHSVLVMGLTSSSCAWLRMGSDSSKEEQRGVHTKASCTGLEADE